MLSIISAIKSGRDHKVHEAGDHAAGRYHQPQEHTLEIMLALDTRPVAAFRDSRKELPWQQTAKDGNRIRCSMYIPSV